MVRHRKTKRRSQKGGFSWNWNPMNWFGSSGYVDPNAPTITEKAKAAANSLNTTIGDAAKSSMNAVTDAATSVVDAVSSPFTSTDSSINQQPIEQSQDQLASYGGRRKRRARSIKGGKGSLGLTYYAAPVSGLKVAEPTYMIGPNTNQFIKMGGSKKRRGCKSCKTRCNRRR